MAGDKIETVALALWLMACVTVVGFIVHAAVKARQPRGKHTRPGLLARLRSWLAGVPHLFAKAMVAHCVICGTMFSAYALRIMSRTGNDPAALLGVILAFFGGELLLLCLKKILGEK